MHTLALPITDVISNIFKGADLDSQIAVAARTTAIALASSTLPAARDAVTTRTVGTLHAYRKHCASSSSQVGCTAASRAEEHVSLNEVWVELWRLSGMWR